MRRFLFVCAAALSWAGIALAQDTPQYELFVGGSYLHVHASGSELTQLLGLNSIQYQPHNMNLNLYGWETTLVENINHWVGGEFDAGGFYGNPGAKFLFPSSQLVSPNPNFSQAVPVTTQMQTYLFGPRFYLHNRGNVVLYAHLPVGIARVSTSLSEQAVVATNFTNLPIGALKTGMGLAFSPGVGMDVRLNGRVTIRVFQLDYLMTQTFGERQDNARLSAGVNFTFGEK